MGLRVVRLGKGMAIVMHWVTGTEDDSGGLYLVDFTPADLVVLQLVPEHSRS